MPKQTIEEHDRNNQNEPLNSLKEIEDEDEYGLNEMVSQKKKKKMLKKLLEWLDNASRF